MKVVFLTLSLLFSTLMSSNSKHLLNSMKKHYWRRTQGKKDVSRLTASSLRADGDVADVVLGSCVAVVAVQSSRVSAELPGPGYTVILRVLYVVFSELL